LLPSLRPRRILAGSQPLIILALTWIPGHIRLETHARTGTAALAIIALWSVPTATGGHRSQPLTSPSLGRRGLQICSHLRLLLDLITSAAVPFDRRKRRSLADPPGRVHARQTLRKLRKNRPRIEIHLKALGCGWKPGGWSCWTTPLRTSASLRARSKSRLTGCR
jgi:hypothetical protein